MCSEEMVENMSLNDFASYIINILENVYPNLKDISGDKDKGGDKDTTNPFSINRKRNVRLSDKCPLNVQSIQYIVCLLNIKLKRNIVLQLKSDGKSILFIDGVMTFIQLVYFCHYKICQIIDHFGFKADLIIKDINGLLFHSKYILFRSLLPYPQFSNEDVFTIIFSDKDYTLEMDDQYYDNQISNNINDLYNFLHIYKTENTLFPIQSTVEPIDCLNLFSKTFAINYFYLFPYKNNVSSNEFNKSHFIDSSLTPPSLTPSTPTTPLVIQPINPLDHVKPIGSLVKPPLEDTPLTEKKKTHWFSPQQPEYEKSIPLHQRFRQRIHHIKYSFKNLSFLRDEKKKYILDNMPKMTLFGLLFSMMIYLERSFDFVQPDIIKRFDIFMFLFYGMIEENQFDEEIKASIQQCYKIELTKPSLQKPIQKTNLICKEETEFDIDVIKEYVKMFSKYCSIHRIPSFNKLIISSYVDCNSPYIFKYLYDAFLQFEKSKKNNEGEKKQEVWKAYCSAYNKNIYKFYSKYQTLDKKGKQKLEYTKLIEDFDTINTLLSKEKEIEKLLEIVQSFILNNFERNITETINRNKLFNSKLTEIPFIEDLKLHYRKLTKVINLVELYNKLDLLNPPKQLLKITLLKINKLFSNIICLSKLLCGIKIFRSKTSLDENIDILIASTITIIKTNVIDIQSKTNNPGLQTKVKILKECLIMLENNSTLYSQYQQMYTFFYDMIMVIKMLKKNTIEEDAKLQNVQLVQTKTKETNIFLHSLKSFFSESYSKRLKFLEAYNESKLAAMTKVIEIEKIDTEIEEDIADEEEELLLLEEKKNEEELTAESSIVTDYFTKIKNLKIEQIPTNEVYEEIKEKERYVEIYIKTLVETFNKQIEKKDEYDNKKYVYLCSILFENVNLLNEDDIDDLSIESKEDAIKEFQKLYDKITVNENIVSSSSFVFWLYKHLKEDSEDLHLLLKKIYIGLEIIKTDKSSLKKITIPDNFKQSSKSKKEQFIIETIKTIDLEKEDIIKEINVNNTKNVLLDLSTNLEHIGLPRFQLFVKTLIYNYFNEKTKLLKKINAIDFSTNIEVYTQELEKLFKDNS